MTIMKLIGVGIICLIFIIIIKQYKPEFAIYVSLIAGVIIIGMVFDGVSEIINLINSYSSKANINNKFIIILLKITGIAILAEFASSICSDAGEKAIATKIDLGSKILIISTSIPIISGLLEVTLKLLP